MYSKGLKTSIILNLLLIIAGAMLLVDLVLISSARQELLKARIATGNALLSAIGSASISGFVFSPAQLSSMLDESSAVCLVVLDSNGQVSLSAGSNCDSISDKLNHDVRLAHDSAKSVSSFTGVTEGIFWHDRKTMLVSNPLVSKGKIVGAVAIALDLSGIYQALRNSQRMFFIYFLINLLVFAAFGFYQIYRWVLKPINRLVATAEEFHDDEGLALFPETRDGEFNRLSHTLNKMLARINRDRGKLQQTITELEESNRQLLKTRQEVVRAEKLASVGRLSAGVAHEIGNPIGIVIGYLDLLKKDIITEDQKKDFIVRAETEVNRINTIIRQMLDFARQPESEQKSEISVHDIIDEVLEICTVQPMMAEISLVSETNASDNLVFANGDQLKQVFVNLLINASDAINSRGNRDKDGLITVKTFNPDNDVVDGKGKFIKIQFSDNGHGIESGDIENIFDPFYTTKDPGKGTGLGLSICFTLIENMGGRIKADSNNEVTTVTVELPLISEVENI